MNDYERIAQHIQHGGNMEVEATNKTTLTAREHVQQGASERRGGHECGHRLACEASGSSPPRQAYGPQGAGGAVVPDSALPIRAEQTDFPGALGCCRRARRRATLGIKRLKPQARRAVEILSLAAQAAERAEAAASLTQATQLTIPWDVHEAEPLASAPHTGDGHVPACEASGSSPPRPQSRDRPLCRLAG